MVETSPGGKNEQYGPHHRLLVPRNAVHLPAGRARAANARPSPSLQAAANQSAFSHPLQTFQKTRFNNFRLLGR